MNIKNNDQFFSTDMHTHCLPGIDDGAKSLDVSLQMLQELQKQGIQRVALTPHYYAHKENLESFLKRRQAAMNLLSSCPNFNMLPELKLGAEIYICRGISESDITSLCIENTNLLLLELPYQSYKAWMLEEIRNLTYALHITPVIAHIERYLAWYSREDYDELLSLDEMMFQFNAESLFDRKAFEFIYKLAVQGCPLVIGSDTHNMTSRSPNFEKAADLLQKKRKGHLILNALQKNLFK